MRLANAFCRFVELAATSREPAIAIPAGVEVLTLGLD
jgi:hypothetical protein